MPSSFVSRFTVGLKIVCLTILLVVLGFALWDGWLNFYNYGYRLSKETTALPQPMLVLKDGLPDYIGSLNQLYSKDVDPKENSAIEYLKILGPRGLNKAQIASLNEHLGANPFEGTSEYLVPISRLGTHDPGRSVDGTTPWKASEAPNLAELIEKNAPLLAKAREISLMKTCFIPLLATEQNSLASSPLTCEHSIGEIVHQLALEASAALVDGKMSRAMENILAIRRMSNQLAQPPYLNAKSLIASSFQLTASELMQSFAIVAVHSKDPQVEQYLSQLHQELDQNASELDWHSTIDDGERLATLDNLMRIASYGPRGTEPGRELVRDINSYLGHNWSYILAATNEDYDEVIKLLKEDDFLTMMNTRRHMESEMIQRTPAPDTFWFMLSRRYRANAMRWKGADTLFPVLVTCTLAKFREQTETRLAHISLNLASYYLKNGRYPESLLDIADTLHTTALDPYTLDPLRYVALEDGKTYRLYSVGPNGVDNNGQPFGQISVDDHPAIYPGPTGPRNPKAL